MTPITNQLLVGSRVDACNSDLLKQQGVDVLLSLASIARPEGVRVQMQLDVRDRIPLPDEMIGQAMDFLHSQLQSGRRVMVHCEMGISRSPALVASYLHQFENLSLDAAISHIQAVRPQAEPHPELVASLHAYHQRRVNQEGLS